MRGIIVFAATILAVFARSSKPSSGSDELLTVTAATRQISVHSSYVQTLQTLQITCLDSNSNDGSCSTNQFRLPNDADTWVGLRVVDKQSQLELPYDGILRLVELPAFKQTIVLQIYYFQFPAALPALASTTSSTNAGIFELKFQAKIPSVYDISSQRTRVRTVGSQTRIISSDEYTAGESANDQSSNSANQITYGPFSQSSVDQLIAISYTAQTSTSPECIAIPSLSRHVELSHTASAMSIHDDLTLSNICGEKSSSFSRLDFQLTHYGQNRADDLNFPLASPQRYGVYVVDHIGNVSTSKLARSKLSIKPRYMLEQGWKYTFSWGYVLPQQLFVRKSTGNTFIVKVPIMEIPSNVRLVNQSFVNVVLPEGATDPVVLQENQELSSNKWEAYTYQIKPRREFKSYLDSTGRVQVQFTGNHLIDDMLTPSEIYIQYQYKTWRILQKPLAVATFFMILFTIASIGRRIRTTFRPSQLKNNILVKETIVVAKS